MGSTRKGMLLYRNIHLYNVHGGIDGRDSDCDGVADYFIIARRSSLKNKHSDIAAPIAPCAAMVDLVVVDDDQIAEMADSNRGAIIGIWTQILPQLSLLHMFLRLSENEESVKVALEGHVLRHAHNILQRTSYQCKFGPLIWSKDMKFEDVYVAKLNWEPGVETMFHYRPELVPRVRVSVGAPLALGNEPDGAM